MIPSPIHRVLSTIRTHDVRALLMGGQACILYGAAEFSRDADLAILATPDNLARLSGALDALGASVIAVPPFEQRYLDKGHAIHFRCDRDDVRGLRVDIMSRMRGVDAFDRLWERRTTLTVADDHGDALMVEALALPDLVAAKKTQRDKDWPMIRRLVEVSYFSHREVPTQEQIPFWLHELRTPELLIECTTLFPAEAEAHAADRAAIVAAMRADVSATQAALDAEQTRERELDRAYWAPLRAELELLRRSRSD